MKLTPKQQRFVEEYVLDLSATQAAIRAGYSAKTAKEQGCQLLHKTTLAAAIQETLAARSEKVAITAEMVVEGLLLEARRVDEGASHSARVTAWTQLGKHLGMFTEKHDLKHKHDYSGLTDEELERKIFGLLASSQLPVHLEPERKGVERYQQVVIPIRCRDDKESRWPGMIPLGLSIAAGAFAIQAI